ncbi:putative bzip transcription factor [Erysiphe necator]|uniref:Putative bzip transcription factor n=1 Tax=Uncinula necator TaxID=52586 RepID=A0A0B1NW54_UNCNE|nr:putative bzip transcription factor [Erysiphe necator]
MDSTSISIFTSANPSPAIAPAHPKLAVRKFDENIDSPGQLKTISNLGLVTQKEWVIPPRPKPGRKPATDTPPTKRKAQNRAAQRAFRERRAARVGELEVQLEEVKEEQQQREKELRNKIEQLEAELERLNAELNSWRLRCNNLNTIFEYEKRAKEATYAELAYLRNGAEITGNDAANLPHREFQATEPDKQRVHPTPGPDLTSNAANCVINSRENESVCIEENFANNNLECDNCTLNGRCVCIEETLKILKRDSISDNERPQIPTAPNFIEKHSHQSKLCTPLETDFTTPLSVDPIDVATESTEQIVPTELCGFCEEGSYCLCAEAVATAATSNGTEPRENFPNNVLSDIASSPSEIDFSNYNKVSNQPSATQKNSAYRTAPGTCQQCQLDPRSGAFCRSLSVMRSLNSKAPEGCCGKNNDGGCCNMINTASCEKPRLSCADTFRTLSCHKSYDRANHESNSWLGLLNATPSSHPGRGPLEVEAASVLEVLRLFDRRFKGDK